MASTNKTAHYDLPQFAQNDVTGWISDINPAMAAIDAGIWAAKQSADSAGTAASDAASAAQAAQTLAQTAKAGADSAQTTATAAQTAAGTATTTAQAASEAVAAMADTIATLGNSKVIAETIEDDIAGSIKYINNKILAIDLFIYANALGTATHSGTLGGGTMFFYPIAKVSGDFAREEGAINTTHNRAYKTYWLKLDGGSWAKREGYIVFRKEAASDDSVVYWAQSTNTNLAGLANYFINLHRGYSSDSNNITGWTAL